MVLKFSSLFFLLWVFYPCRCNGQELDSMKTRLDSIITDGIDSMAYPGATIYIIYEGKELYHQTYGYHTYEKNNPVKEDDIYDFASITKVTSSLPVLMQLYGQGKFDLDAKLKKYFPPFRKSDMGNLTFRKMLAHQAGLQPYIVFWQEAFEDDGSLKKNSFAFGYSPEYPIKLAQNLYIHKDYKEKMYKTIRKADIEDHPEYRYSGLLFLILPDIISRLVGDDFETYLYEHFFVPMGLEIAYNPRKRFPHSRIIPTEKDDFFRYEQVDGMVHDEAAAMLGGVSGNAGLFGTARSLGKLFQMYLNGGEIDGRRYIASDALREFTRYQYPEAGNRRGLGFDKPLLEYNEEEAYVARDASAASFGHSGFTGTFVWADPEYDLVFVFMTNRVYPTRNQRKLYTMKIRPKIHQRVYEYLKK